MMEVISVKNFCSILTSDDLYSELIKYIVNNDLIYKEVVKDFLHKKCGIIDESIENDILIKSLVKKLSAFISNLKDDEIIEKPNVISYKIVEENSNIDFETVIRKSGGSFYIYVPVDVAKEHNLKKNERAIINLEILN